MEKEKVPSDPWTMFALSVFRLNGQIVTAGESISGSVGQTSARWQVLGTVYEPKTVAEIARIFGISRQGVQRVTNTLILEGLVESRPHPADKRTFLIELTPKGREVLSRIYSKQLAWSRAIVKKLGIDRLVKTTELLIELGNAFEPEVQIRKKRRSA